MFFGEIIELLAIDAGAVSLCRKIRKGKAIIHNAIPSSVHVARSSELYARNPAPSGCPWILYSPNHQNRPVSLSIVIPPAWALMMLPLVSSHLAPGTMYLARAVAASRSVGRSDDSNMARRLQRARKGTHDVQLRSHAYIVR